MLQHPASSVQRVPFPSEATRRVFSHGCNLPRARSAMAGHWTQSQARCFKILSLTRSPCHLFQTHLFGARSTMTIPNSSASTSYAPRKITIGVLALQGAFIEHIHYLQSLSIPSTTIHAIPIRTAAELELCDALVIPGGESTVIQSVAERTAGLLPLLQEFVRDPNRPVWGTCAGMILMAEEDGIGGGKVIKGRSPPKGWGGIDGLRVWRNLYGSEYSPVLYNHSPVPCNP